MHPLRFPLLAAWILIGLASASGPARAQCPPDTLCVVTGCSPKTASQGSASGGANGTSSSASYDLLALQFSVGANAGAGDLYAGYGAVYANDLYTVSGPPEGTPVALGVQVHVNGYFVTGGSFPSASGSASVTGPDGAPLSISGGAVPAGFGYYGYVDTTAVLPVAVTSGVPFPLRWTVGAGVVSGSASLGITAAFVNAPAGTVIHSCQGYSSGSATAARKTTWGRVKAHYR